MKMKYLHDTYWYKEQENWYTVVNNNNNDDDSNTQLFFSADFLGRALLKWPYSHDNSYRDEWSEAKVSIVLPR